MPYRLVRRLVVKGLRTAIICYSIVISIVFECFYCVNAIQVTRAIGKIGAGVALSHQRRYRATAFINAAARVSAAVQLAIAFKYNSARVPVTTPVAARQTGADGISLAPVVLVGAVEVMPFPPATITAGFERPCHRFRPRLEKPAIAW